MSIFALYAVGVGFNQRYARRRVRRFLEPRQGLSANDAA
jgi:hypothetical protein